MITATIMGGAGNQCFVVFTLLAYAMDNKTSFYIEDKPIEHGVRKKHYWDTMLSTIGRFRKPCQPNNIIVREQGFAYNKLPTISDVSKPVKIIGYFQSYKYFEHQYENIMKFIKLDKLREPFTTLYDYNNTISLHFRVGDYKMLQDHHPLLDESYYVKALKHISKGEACQVLYFCEDEDIDYVDNKLNIIKKYLPKLTFVKIDSKYDDWEQMMIMSLCKHNIIANSSFSWWAAYFNTNDKIVCYPTTWFGPKQGNKDMSTMFPPNWIKIDS
jgi:hypothetical protein